MCRSRVDRPSALHAGTDRWTHGQLHDTAARAASVLAAFGVRRGDRILLALPDNPSWPGAFLAGARLGPGNRGDAGADGSEQQAAEGKAAEEAEGEADAEPHGVPDYQRWTEAGQGIAVCLDLPGGCFGVGVGCVHW